MNISLQHVNPTATRVYMGVLTGGDNLHDAFTTIATKLNIHAATFELLGGLSEVEFTAYDFVSQTRLAPIIYHGAMEIVSGHGTISLLDDQPYIHTHIIVAFRDSSAPNGIAVMAGHAARALVFAVEFTLTIYDGIPVNRAHDELTGLKLWNLPALK